ncbi:MAG: hypothetical protein GX942_08745, partial [Papillibacter sp.]|nr:hypothetical protein [Papillibacter sp.]
MKKLTLPLILILILTLSACNKKLVNAHIVQNETEFSATYDLLNTELSHDIELKEGDLIAV